MNYYRGDFVHFPSLTSGVQLCRDHLLATDKYGYISHFEPADSLQSEALLDINTGNITIIPSGSFCVPTFCDLHLHAPQFLYQGTGLHLPLMQWLEEYAFKAEERIDSDPQFARTVYSRLAQRLVENGTGAVLLFGTIGVDTNLILAEEMQQAGIRAFVGKLSMNQNSRPTYTEHDTQTSLNAATSFLSRMDEFAHRHSECCLVKPVLTPRFVPTCSDDLLKGLAELSQSKGVMVQSHLAEAHDQVAWVKAERGLDDIDVFDRSNLLGSRTIQAHCTYLSSPEFDILASRGTAIAHCPLSNAYFSARPLALREALTAGVRVGLGTDVAGGYSANIMDAMRWAVGVSRMRDGARIESAADGEGSSVKIDWMEAMFLATRGGAEALGLDCGVFKVGAPFDAQCVKLFDPSSGRGVGQLEFLDVELGTSSKDLTVDMVEKWFCLGDHGNRTGMWVQGRKIGTW